MDCSTVSSNVRAEGRSRENLPTLWWEEKSKRAAEVHFDKELKINLTWGFDVLEDKSICESEKEEVEGELSTEAASISREFDWRFIG